MIRRIALLSLFAAAPLTAQSTRAERSKYAETSTYQDVIAFVDSLQARGAKIHVGNIGKTSQGRDLPYIIASRPLVTTPLEAKRLGRPIVYIQGNIHAGEVEGKEALQAVVRDLVFDPKPNVLDSIVLVAVPIYNGDGNEVFGPQARQRGAQNGPEMVGQRPNGQQFDLNRDYIKAEAPETRASLAMFNAWDPDLFVDLHTTDGSYHGYALTYSPSLHPAAAIAGGTFGGAFVRDSMLPIIRTRMRTRHKYEVFDYGNFSGDEGPAAQGEARSWSTYEHKPRYGTNYYGLRGRLSILSEAYSHDPFERRVKSTYAFVKEILTLTSEKARNVLAITRGADAAIAAGKVGPVPIRAVLTKKPAILPVIEEPLDTIPAAKGQITAGRGRGAGPGQACAWPISEPGVRCGFQRSGKFVTIKMPVKDRFDATLTTTLPVAWLLPRNASTDSVLARLRLHGVVVEQLTSRLDVAGASFAVDSAVKSGRPFQGHSELRIEGSWTPNAHLTAEPGAYLVRANQPLAVLAALMLEPQSDDGLATWNFFDVVLEPLMTSSAPRLFPVHRITAPITASTRIIP